MTENQIERAAFQRMVEKQKEYLSRQEADKQLYNITSSYPKTKRNSQEAHVRETELIAESYEAEKNVKPLGVDSNFLKLTVYEMIEYSSNQIVERLLELATKSHDYHCRAIGSDALLRLACNHDLDRKKVSHFISLRFYDIKVLGVIVPSLFSTENASSLFRVSWKYKIKVRWDMFSFFNKLKRKLGLTE